jgi:hypothetical protein
MDGPHVGLRLVPGSSPLNRVSSIRLSLKPYHSYSHIRSYAETVLQPAGAELQEAVVLQDFKIQDSGFRIDAHILACGSVLESSEMVALKIFV